MAKTAVKPRTLSDFRAAHDKDVVIPNKIRAALEAMAKEHAERWCYEGEDPDVGPGILKRTGISTTDLGRYRERFEAHIVVVPGRNGKSQAKRVWFATIKAAEAARK